MNTLTDKLAKGSGQFPKNQSKIKLITRAKKYSPSQSKKYKENSREILLVKNNDNIQGWPGCSKRNMHV